MIRAWRITHSRFANQAFDGEGAFLYGGRWNNPGVRIIYVSNSLALATLELLVNGVRPSEVDQFVCIPVDFPQKLVQILDVKTLPANWAESPAPYETKTIGDALIKSGKPMVLQVPSAVIPDESNFLINPLEMKSSTFKIGSARPFAFDRRLFQS